MDEARIAVRKLPSRRIVTGAAIVLLLTGCSGEPDAVTTERVVTSTVSSAPSGDVASGDVDGVFPSKDPMTSDVSTVDQSAATGPPVIASEAPVTTAPASDVPTAAELPVFPPTVNTLQVFSALRTAQLTPATDTAVPANGSTNPVTFVASVYSNVTSVWGGYLNAIQAGTPPALTFQMVDVLPTSCGGATVPALPPEDAAPLYCGVTDGLVYPTPAIVKIWSDAQGQAAVGDLAAAMFVSRPYSQYVIDLIKAQLGLPDFDTATTDRSLMADCLTGNWAYAANGGLSAADITTAMALQPTDTGSTNGQPTGSAAQRTAAFQRGYEQGAPGACVSGYWTGMG